MNIGYFTAIRCAVLFYAARELYSLLLVFFLLHCFFSCFLFYLLFISFLFSVFVIHNLKVILTVIYLVDMFIYYHEHYV